MKYIQLYNSCFNQDLVQLKEEPLDVINGDIEKDPLAIEETNLVKLENFKVENESVTLKKVLESLQDISSDDDIYEYKWSLVLYSLRLTGISLRWLG
ncbi:uncharacterized protein LOC142333556 isoform X2 [Lycorma delicatula]|uniref:uncharacterized protein LOC142333556 isoform X2 n=1 Tax=Lycorma delicatula TaxID=130591 RepID=UPI003F515292